MKSITGLQAFDKSNLAEGLVQWVDAKTEWRGRYPWHANIGDVLPPNDFPTDLRREKRRAERSRLPLSIVLCRVDASVAEPGKD
ncbi:MAG TPA: hypothetical protein VFP68_21715, partial [Burkholderiaceae bacterium]|nr:hypothetical protein [Burkholderiaceae bacterium]